MTNDEPRTTNYQLPIILALTLAAFALRVYRLDFQSLWIDEGLTLRYAQLSFPDLLATLRSVRAVPPLYHVLTVYWVQWAGDSDFALRFLSLVFSVLAVPLIFRLGRSLGSEAVGMVAAFLLAVSPYQIWHAQDARNYSLLTAASLMSMWGFVNVLRVGGWRWWLIYLLGTEVAILTHYHGLLVIGVQGLFLLFTWRDNFRHYLRWGAALIALLTPLAVWMLVGSRAWQGGHWLPQVGLLESYLRGAIAYSVGEMVPRPAAIWLMPAFAVAYGLGLLMAVRRRWAIGGGGTMVAFLAAYTLAPNFAAWLVSQWLAPVYLERYLIMVQTGYLLAVAIGLVGLWQWQSRPFARVSATILLVGLTVISAWVIIHHYTDPLYAKPDWRGVAQTIETFQLPDDGVVMTGTGGEFLFDHYYHGGLTVRHDFNTPAPSAPEAEKIIAQIAAENDRLWFTPYGEPIDPTLENWLAQNAFPAWQKWVGRKNLLLYRTGNPALARLETIGINFGGAMLDTVSLPDAPVAAGDILPLESVWHADSPVSADVKISLRLVNATGDIFAQSDFPPFAVPPSTWMPGEPQTDRRGLWIPADTPPGLYDVRQVVYDGANGQPLGDAVLISAVEISAATIAPSAAALDVPQNGNVPLGAVTLVGHIAPQTVSVGGEVWLWLYFRAEESAPPDTPLVFTLTDGSRTETIPLALAGIAGDPTGWQAGQMRRGVVHLPAGSNFSGDLLTVQLSAGNAAPQTVAVVEIGEK